jgi:phosphatidate cytidylyltransferase
LVRRPRFRKSSSLMARVISAAVLIPLSLYLIYEGPPLSLIIGGLITLGLSIEWFYLCFKNRFSLWLKVAFILLGTAYLGISILWILQHFTASDGWRIIFWLLFVAWSTDTAAFVGGKLLKGPKLAPSISPNKTWSGFVSGILLGTAVGYETSFWLLPGIFNLWGVLLLTVIAQMGDLLESQAKRWSQVKDSSMLIPGHGGLLDRLDSLLAMSFALFLWGVLRS